MTSEPGAGWAVVVPVKAVRQAKSRLATTVATRSDLARAFALDVVAAALATPRVVAVVVVADDEDVRAAATAQGADPIPDTPAAGLVPALLAGHERVCARHPGAWVALLAADLPALRSTDLAAALTAAQAHDRAFVSDLVGTGTTLLTVRAGVAPDPRFGPRSRAAHAASGAVELTGADLARLRCDVDTEVDLWYARSLGVGPRTAAVLAGDG